MPETQKNQNEEPEGEILDFNKPDYVFIPKGYHEWKQRGPYCVCLSCELEHGIYIGVEQHLMGIDDQGMPILKKVSVNG